MAAGAEAGGAAAALHPIAGADSKGKVTLDEDGLFLVTYPHTASRTEFLLGMFETEEETKRVRDVLTIKEAVDEGRDMRNLRLFFPLQRYGVDSATAREIRAVSFRQVVRDLQVCAIKPLRSPDDQQPTSWVGGAISRPTNGTTANTLHIAGGAVAAKAPPAVGQPPRQQQLVAAAARPGAMGPPPSRGQSSPAMSPAAGQRPPAAMAPLAAGAPAPSAFAPFAQPAAAPANRARPVQPPPRFNQLPPLPPLPSMLRQDEIPRGGRKRQLVDDSETSDDEKSGLQGLMKGVGIMAAQRGSGMPTRSSSLPLSGVDDMAAGGRSARAAKQQRRGSASPAAKFVPGERPWQDQDVLAFTPADHPFHGITREGGYDSNHMSAQIIIRYENGLPHAQGHTKRVVRFARCSCPALAAVTWDLVAIWRALRYGEDPAELDDAAEANRALNFSFARYAPHLPALRAAQSEAAIKDLVRELRDEPGQLEFVATGRPTRPANGPAAGPAAGAAGTAAAAAAMKAGDSEDAADPPAPAAAAGAMAVDPPPAAAGGQGRQAAVPPAAPATAAQAVAPAAAPASTPAAAQGPGSPAAGAAAAAAAAPAGGTPAAQGDDGGGGGGGKRRGGRRAAKVAAPRGSSGFKGVYGDGPWYVQVALRAKRLLPGRMRGWSSSRDEQAMRVGSCSSPALGAACADLLALWRAKQYGDAAESVALNFPLELYTPFQPGLDGVDMAGIQAHVVALRDGGSLQALVEAGQRAKQAGQAQQAAQEAQQAQQGEQTGSGAAAAAAAAAADADAALGQQAAVDRHAAAAGTAVGAGDRASVPAPGSAEQQQEQRSRGQGAAAAAAAAAAAGETSAAATARAAAAAAPPVPADPVLAAAQGVLQHLRTLTAAELQQAAYRRDEVPQVQVTQAMYAEVQAALAAAPQISEMEAVAYLARFAANRDMRTQFYREILAWSAAGRHDLLTQHVRYSLPPLPPGA